MSKQFDGVPKGAPFYNSGAGPLDEKSWVEHIEDLKTLDESKFKDKQKVYCFEDQSDYQLNKSATPTAELGRWEKKETANVGVSVKRLGAYTYEATFDTMPKYKASNAPVSGACSAYVRDGKLYRNYDWKYNNMAIFKVICKDFVGMANIDGLDDGVLDFEKVGQLPYNIKDGVNSSGIMIATLVLHNDFDFEGTEDKENDISTLPYFLLNNLQDIDNINSIMDPFLSNVKVNGRYVENGFLPHYIVSNGVSTFNITPKVDGTGYEIIEITSNPKLTNFKWVDRAVVEDRTASDIQDHPNGIERFNSIGADTELESLKYTNAYESADWLSEFIGMNGTDKTSTDAELLAIYNVVKTHYRDRSRDDEEATWQTVYSIVYSKYGIEHLYTQENYEKDYISDTKIKNATIQAGDTEQTIEIPKNKHYVSSYCVDENNNIVVVPTKVNDATVNTEGSVVFTLTNAVDHNIKCIVVCV